MKTTLLAAAAVLCLGTGAAYADQGDSEDGSYIPNTFFTELPGVDATAPGAQPNNVAPNAFISAPQSTTTTSAVPPANATTVTTTAKGS